MGFTPTDNARMALQQVDKVQSRVKGDHHRDLTEREWVVLLSEIDLNGLLPADIDRSQLFDHENVLRRVRQVAQVPQPA